MGGSPLFSFFRNSLSLSFFLFHVGQQNQLPSSFPAANPLPSSFSGGGSGFLSWVAVFFFFFFFVVLMGGEGGGGGVDCFLTVGCKVCF